MATLAWPCSSIVEHAHTSVAMAPSCHEISRTRLFVRGLFPASSASRELPRHGRFIPFAAQPTDDHFQLLRAEAVLLRLGELRKRRHSIIVLAVKLLGS